MKVTMIAKTDVQPEAYAKLDNDGGADDATYLTEYAGRGCYQSWNRPNPKTADSAAYVQSAAIEKGHGSILEHASVTFEIEDVSRSLTHELIRHRSGFSYSQLSQRYVPGDQMKMVIHPTLRDEDLADHLMEVWDFACEKYDLLCARLEQRGYSVKRAREAAREVLPNATETKIVVTANHRAWRHFLNLRLHPAADAQIRELAAELLRQLYLEASPLYADFVNPMPAGNSTALPSA